MDADPAVVDPLHGLVGKVVLVLDLADDLLQQVLERHDSLDGAVLVDDERQVLVLAPELAEERGEVLRLRDDVGRTHDLLDGDVLDPAVVEGAEEVADVEDADDVVERAAVDGIAGVRGVDHRRKRLLRGELDGEGDDLGPRDHDVVGLLVGEVEDLVEHLLLRLLDLLGLRDDQADVLLRVHRHPGGRRLGRRRAARCRSPSSGAPRRAGRRPGRASRAATASQRARRSARWSAIDFGTSSPRTTLR